MEKKELVQEIAKKLNEIKDLYYEVYPEGDYLSLFIGKESISFNNESWEGGEDENYPINYWEGEDEW